MVLSTEYESEMSILPPEKDADLEEFEMHVVIIIAYLALGKHINSFQLVEKISFNIKAWL